MALLEIVTAPDPILTKKSLPVESVDDGVRKIMDDMLDTVVEGGGASALAAVQVGILKRIIILHLGDDDDLERPEGFYPLFMANPEITYASENMVVAKEGCMSLPDQRIEIERPEEIEVKYLDYNNKEQSIRTPGWLARAIQHEIDHLDGKLMINYLSPLKRDAALRRLAKLKKHYH